MSLKINQNIFSMIVQRNLGRASRQLEQSYEHISSGQRINRSADDPSGMATSERVRYEIQGLRQNQQNISGASSMIGTAESQLRSLNTSLQRARELAVQAGNGTLSPANRQAIQTELNSLLDEINRIATTAKYNDQYLLNGQLQNVRVQAGTGSSDTLAFSLGDFRTAALGAWAEKVTEQAVNGAAIGAGQLLINGIAIPASRADGLSTSQAAASAIAKANAINQVEAQTGVRATVQPAVLTAAGALQAVSIDGTNRVLTINGVSISPVTVQAGDANGALRQAINGRSGQTGVTASLSSSGALVLTAQDGRNIEVVTQGSIGDELGLRGGDGDVNMVGAARLSLSSTQSFSINDASGLLGLTAAAQQVDVDPNTAIQYLSAATSEDAGQALRGIDAALAQISQGQSVLGALTNRLEGLNDTLASRIEDLTSADSRIRDADIAYESAQQAQAQILQDTALAMLAQANVMLRRALDLLRGN